MIYLDHNATTPLHPRALEAMLPFFEKSFGNPSSYHRIGRQARTAVEQSRTRIAQLLGCDAPEIIFTSGATEADNLAIRGIAQALRSRGTHIITSTVEHHAVLKTCQALEAAGWHVTYLPVDRAGRVDPADLEKNIRADTILISIMYANNETGVVQPLADLSTIARRHGILFHTDAVQAFGKLPLPRAPQICDLMSLSSHKIYGPKGIGALYVKKGTPLTPVLTGGHHEFGLRAGTENVPAIVGFATAAEIAWNSCTQESVRLAGLRDRFEEQLLASIPEIIIHGKAAHRLPNTSSISFLSVESESILLHLDLMGICASAGSACTTGEPEPSHVLRAMGCTPQVAQTSVRFSFGRETSEGDLDTVIKALETTIRKLRGISSIA